MRRSFSLICAIAMVAASAWAQAPKAAPYKAPRTIWGTPDLQGYYVNRTAAPVERPQNLGAKEWYTEEEYAANEKAAAARAAAPTQPGTAADAHYDLSQFGLDAGSTGNVRNLRTSIVTGKTGRIPALTPAAQQRVDAARKAAAGHEMDGPENRAVAERCILWTYEGPPITPGGYNPNFQILQADGLVIIRHEMMGKPHIIRTDGSPHIPAAIRQYYGDSIGHWEGETLVVDTTNFNDTPAMGRNATRDLHVVERFTRVAENAIQYEFTVEDPSTWVEPWSGTYPFTKFDGPIYEYACQEGNYGMPNILSGARAAERKAAGK